MRLPQGWNSELKGIEAQISQVEKSHNVILQEMDKELKKVEREYRSRMQFGKLKGLRNKLKSAQETVRETYPITPPEIKEFEHVGDAARVLAHYWQGRVMSQNRLILGIAEDHIMYAKAADYADLLTAPKSPERDLVDRAKTFLWKDYKR